MNAYATLRELAANLAKRECSSVELTQYYLDRIAQYDKTLNSFITVCTERALAEARKSDDARAQGDTRPLLGLPIAHKDIFCTQDILTTAASRMLANFTSPYDATVVSRLSAAGMVTLGKTNLDEFAMGSSNENSFYGSVKNPWDTARVPGGSSGGSAAAVAGALAPAATGTDTGGSLRQPAAFCGISTLKPTYGRVSRYGMIAFASSLDQGGPMAHSVDDLALLMEAMAGFDERDSTSVAEPVPHYSLSLENSLQGLKIGVPEEYLSPALDPAIADCINAALKIFEQQGAHIQTIHLPHTEQALPAYYVIAPAECSSNLARYDGVRYGHRCEAPKDLTDLISRSRSEGFGAEVKRRILVGTYVLSSGYYDAYYMKAQKIRRLISEDFTEAFAKVDVIMGPTTPTTAFKLGEKASNPVAMYLSDIYTVPSNLAGLPALSIPCGFVSNLPVGLHIVGKHFSEAHLLNVGHQYQCHTDWHRRTPSL